MQLALEMAFACGQVNQVGVGLIESGFPWSVPD